MISRQMGTLRLGWGWGLGVPPKMASESPSGVLPVSNF